MCENMCRFTSERAANGSGDFLKFQIAIGSKPDFGADGYVFIQKMFLHHDFEKIPSSFNGKPWGIMIHGRK